MGLFSWLKKKPALEGEPPAVEERAETTAEVAEALDSHNGAVRVDAARAMLDRARMGDAEAAQALAGRMDDLLSDDEPSVRTTGLSALRVLRSRELFEQHQSTVLALLADRVAQVRTTAVWSAASIPSDTARTQVRAVLSSDEEPLRFAAACALSELGDPAAVPELTSALREDHRRQEALSALLALGDPGALPHVSALFEEESLGELDRTLAAAVLHRLGDARGGEHLCARIGEGSDDAPIAAEWAGRLRVADAIPPLEEVAEREGDPSRGAALRALGRLQAPGAEDRLLALVRSAEEAEDLRMDAAEGLAELGTPQAIEALEALSREEGELGSLCRELLAEVAESRRSQERKDAGAGG